MNSALALAVASIFCNSYSFANFSKTLLQCSSLNALASMVMPRYFCLIAFSLCFCLNAFALRISWMIYLNAFASMPLPQCLISRISSMPLLLWRCINAFASMPHLKDFFNALSQEFLECLYLNACASMTHLNGFPLMPFASIPSFNALLHLPMQITYSSYSWYQCNYIRFNLNF